MKDLEPRKKFSKKDDLLILVLTKENTFLIFLFSPLTLTLSPQVGRGDWKEFSLAI